MSESGGWTARLYRPLNRLHAVLSARTPTVPGFVSPPEPKAIGDAARGARLRAGSFVIAGNVVQAPDTSIWDVGLTDPAFVEMCHGFGWLDDLAAVDASGSLARQWTQDWIARYGRGRGPGWTPQLTGRRLIRWISHGVLLLDGRDATATRAFFRSLARQTTFLARRKMAAPPGRARIEALTGLICAGVSLGGMARVAIPAAAALGRECAARIDDQGGIPTRNPEELLEVLTLLIWAAEALSDAGKAPHKAHADAIARIAPTLRALRHADGGLARFHGGDRGPEGRLDQALASAGVKAPMRSGLAMGFARLSAGRTTVIVDADCPPKGRNSVDAHASTLAFELTSGRRPLIVSCGSGAQYGADWHRAGRATPSHSVLSITGFSSSRLEPEADIGGATGAELIHAPTLVKVEMSSSQDGTAFFAGHDGYVATHGLTHVRKLELGFDGRMLRGSDTLGAASDADRRRFDIAIDRATPSGVRFSLRFHLHPDVDADLDMGGTAVSMALKSGEVWLFRHDGIGVLSLEPSVYLEQASIRPRAALQIVIQAAVQDFTCHIGWTLAKAHDTPRAIRDIGRDDPS